MPTYTTRLNLPKPLGNENVTRQNHNDLVDAIEASAAPISSAIAYGVTTGTNTYTVTPSPALVSYVDGSGVAIKIGTTNTGASTINVNGLGVKNILDSKGNAMTAGKLRATSIYNLRYNGTDFISQGEGASGNAVASDLLSGKTASTDVGDITGTMPNNGAVNRTPSNVAQSIPAGYTTGGTVGAVPVDATKVLTGTTIAGTAGNMPNNGAVTITPSASNQTIASGYHNGSGLVNGVAVPAANVLTGTTIAGTAGTMPNNGSPTWTPNTTNQNFGAGYYSGGTILGDPDLNPNNILNGANIFNVIGNVQPRAFASGSTLTDNVSSTQFDKTGATVGTNGRLQVSGLGFTPYYVVVTHSTNGYVITYVNQDIYQTAFCAMWNGSSMMWLRNSGNCQVFSASGGGFHVPTPMASTTYSWWAAA